MKFSKISLFSYFCCVLPALQAAADKQAVSYITLPKTGIIKHAEFDSSVLPLDNMAAIALIDETAAAAKIELKNMHPKQLISLISINVSDDVKRFLEEENKKCVVSPFLQADIITFIKRCSEGFLAVPEDQKKDMYLVECDTICHASRSKNPIVRSTFEQMIGDAIAPRHVETYCGFATGALLQDLRLLEQWKEQGKKIKKIVLIDSQYNELITAVTQGQKSSFFLPSNQSMNDVIDYAKCSKHYCFNGLMRIADRVKIIQQFAERLASLYPESLEGIYVYADASDYARDCQQFHDRRADVLVGCDLRHKDSLNAGGSVNWAKAWQDYYILEGNSLQISAVSALLTIGGGKDLNRAFMHVKGTTGLAIKHCVHDAEGLREITQQEHDELVEKIEKIEK